MRFHPWAADSLPLPSHACVGGRAAAFGRYALSALRPAPPFVLRHSRCPHRRPPVGSVASPCGGVEDDGGWGGRTDIPTSSLPGKPTTSDTGVYMHGNEREGIIAGVAAHVGGKGKAQM